MSYKKPLRQLVKILLKVKKEILWLRSPLRNNEATAKLMTTPKEIMQITIQICTLYHKDLQQHSYTKGTSTYDVNIVEGVGT